MTHESNWRQFHLSLQFQSSALPCKNATAEDDVNFHPNEIADFVKARKLVRLTYRRAPLHCHLGDVLVVMGTYCFASK